MSTYGDPIDIDPQEALLLEVQRTAGHVEWMRQLINSFGEKAQERIGPDGEIGQGTETVLAQFSPTLGLAPSVWLQIYQEERKHLVRASQAAIAAGVSERRVRVMEEQARHMAMIFKAFLMNAEMGFTPQQRLAAPGIIRQLMQTDNLELEAQAAATGMFADAEDAVIVDDEG